MHLDHCQVKERDAIDLLACLEPPSSVRLLSLRDNHLKSEFGSALLDALRESDLVEVVNVLGNDIFAAASRFLESASPSSHVLSYVGATEANPEAIVVDMSSSDALLVAADVRRGEYLKYLSIHKSVDLDVILEQLDGNRSVVSLKLVDVVFSTQIVSSLSFLQGCMTLRTLEVSLDKSSAISAMTTSSLIALLHVVEGSRSITSLNLGNVVFTDDSIISLCQVIKNNRRVLRVGLFNCSLSPSNFQAITRCLEASGGLRVFRFADMDLKANDITTLRNALKKKATPLVVRVDSNEYSFGPAPEGELWEVGDRVEVEGKTGWASAQVMAVHRDGDSYSVQFDNGSDDTTVAARSIRRSSGFSQVSSLEISDLQLQRRWGRRGMTVKPVSSPRGRAADERKADVDTSRQDIHLPSGQSESNGREPFMSGEMVEVRFYGDGAWYPGRVTRTYPSGSVDLRMEDGSPETEVEWTMVRKPSPKNPRYSAYDKGYYVRGDYVELKTSGAWKRARVAMDNNDGTYDLRMEDASDTKGVEGRWIRHLFRANDSVFVRRGDGDSYDAGRVEAHSVDGSYAVRLEDGRSEKGVAARRICPASRIKIIDSHRAAAVDTFKSNPRSASPAKFSSGDRVEVRLSKRDDRWNAGKVLAINTDGTYSVRFLDGTSLERAEQNDMRSPTSHGNRTPTKVTVTATVVEEPPPKARSESALEIPSESVGQGPGDTGASGAVLLKGSKVLARAGEGDDWRTGEVVKVRFNGTYDVQYDDGSTAQSVSGENIRDMLTGESPARREARDRRKSPSVLFSKTSAPAVRVPDHTAAANPSNKEVAAVNGAPAAEGRKKLSKKAFKTLSPGVRVAVREGASWARGVVARSTGPAVYDVVLDNNKLVQNVPEAYLKVVGEKDELLDLGQATFTPLGFAAGQQVDVKPRGSDKYLPGVVVAVHSSGHYDVQLYEGSYLQGVKLSMLAAASPGQFVSQQPGARINNFSKTRQIAGTSTDTFFGVSFRAAVSQAKWTPFVAYVADNSFDRDMNRYDAPGRLPPGSSLTVVPSSEWCEFHTASVQITHTGDRASVPLFLKLKQGAPKSVAVKVIFFVRELIVGVVTFSVGLSKEVSSAREGKDSSSSVWLDKQAPMLRTAYVIPPDDRDIAESLLTDAVHFVPGFTVRLADRNLRLSPMYSRTSQIVQVVGDDVVDDSAQSIEAAAVIAALNDSDLFEKVLQIQYLHLRPIHSYLLALHHHG